MKHYSQFWRTIKELQAALQEGEGKRDLVQHHPLNQVLYTLNSVTGSGHVKFKRNSLACKMLENLAFNAGDSAYMRVHLLKSMTSSQLKVKKGLVMYLTNNVRAGGKMLEMRFSTYGWFAYHLDQIRVSNSYRWLICHAKQLGSQKHISKFI